MTTTSGQRSPATNTGLAKVAVQCSADTFVVKQSLVLRINISGENRHLRQAATLSIKNILYISSTILLNTALGRISFLLG